MATSGSFNTTAHCGRYLTFSWTRSDYSIENNTSTISWSLTGAGDSTEPDISFYYAGSFTVEIDGNTVYSSSERIKLYKGTSVASGTVTLTHSADGSRSFSASASAAIYYYSINATGSGSFTLNTIPRPSTYTIANGTLGTAQTITISRASSNFTHKLWYRVGSNSWVVVASNVGTSYSWTPPLSLASYNTTGASVSVTFSVETFSGSTSIGWINKNIILTIPASVKPTCSFTFSDTTGYMTTYGGAVQRCSKLAICITGYPAYGSAIRSYSVTVDGKTYSGSSVTTQALNGTGTLTISATVTDARGRTSTADTNTVTVLPYNAPTVTLNAYRCTSTGTADPEGAYMKISLSGSISSLNNQNSATYAVKYKKTSDQSWTTLSGSGTSYTSAVIACEAAAIWNVEGSITDELLTTTKAENIPMAFVLMDFYSSGKGIAFGKVAEQDGFDCDMISLFKKNVYFTGDVEFLGDVDLGGGVIADYIIAQGTSGGWNYRKWYSGKLELLGYASGTLSNPAAWGSLYYAGTALNKSFPTETGLTFTSKPYVFADLYSNSGGWLEIDGQATTTQTANYYFMRPVNTGFSGTWGVSLFVIGYWR